MDWVEWNPFWQGATNMTLDLEKFGLIWDLNDEKYSWWLFLCFYYNTTPVMYVYSANIHTQEIRCP
jgi:hypothetical protein